jgi:tetratricopeptide (TPR) repeat protein
MTSDQPEITEAETERMAAFLSRCVEEILQGGDAASFFQWIGRTGPKLLGGPFLEAPDEQSRRALSFALGSAIWNATPRPDNDYRPRPLPRPERNEPCPCGSGRKYKKCCANAPAFPPIDVDEIWSLVVEHLPMRELVRLARERALPIAALERTAERLRAAGKSREAVKLLEPLFDTPDRLDERHEGILDLLLDLYEEARWPARKAEMMERLERRLRPPLRAVLLQRLASIAAGTGQSAAAWDFFERARRDDPEHPSLAGLEVLLLGQDGKPDRAAERARFWLARLRRQGTEGLERPIAFLEQVAADPLAALSDICGPRESGAVGRLVEIVRRASDRPVPGYDVAADGDQLSLVTPARLLKLEKKWARVWPVVKPFSIQLLGDESAEPWDEPHASRWLAFLERQPEAFDSLSILDDLALAAHALTDGESRAMDDALVIPLTRRGDTILERAVADHPEGRVPWIDLDNRPALRLLALNIAARERQGDAAGAVASMERLLELNPDDNHGYRALLVNHYLRAGQDERALALAARNPEDVLAETRYGCVLALWRLGRRGEALTALSSAVDVMPFVPGYLLEPDARPPKLEADGVSIGGRDQAWVYRESARDLWRDTPGALEWLAQCAPPLVARRGRGPRPPKR